MSAMHHSTGTVVIPTLELRTTYTMHPPEVMTEVFAGLHLGLSVCEHATNCVNIDPLQVSGASSIGSCVAAHRQTGDNSVMTVRETAEAGCIGHVCCCRSPAIPYPAKPGNATAGRVRRMRPAPPGMTPAV